MSGGGDRTLAPEWLDYLQHQLNETVEHYSVVGGGDFAQTYRATLQSGKTIFVKTHQHSLSQFFITEAAGLRWLGDTQTVAIPEVLAVADDPPLLAMEWIEAGLPNLQTDVDFGRSLAGLHQTTDAHFGRPDLADTGSQGVPNQRCDTWAEFYATQRLMPLIRLARDRNALPEKTIRQLDLVASRLNQLDAELGGLGEPPALLHGDLWAGNRVVDHQGRSWLIDPAAHYGHREFDLAMMRLFGGYSEACFASYIEAWPLAEGFATRVSLHQLAPLVVHAIKFGGHYAQATATAVQQYT